MSFSLNICALVVLLCTSGIAVTGNNDNVVDTTVAGSNSKGAEKRNQESLVNYISTAVLPDGESETRMRFGDIIVREASMTRVNEAGVR